MVGVSHPDIGTENFLAPAILCAAAATAALVRTFEAMGSGDDVPGLQSSPCIAVASPVGYDRPPTVETAVQLLLQRHQPGEGALPCAPPAHDTLHGDAQGDWLRSSPDNDKRFLPILVCYRPYFPLGPVILPPLIL